VTGSASIGRTGSRSQTVVATTGVHSAPERRRSSPLEGTSRLFGPADVLFLVAWGLWIAALLTTSIAHAQGSWGLIPALPWTFYFGVSLLLVSVAIQLGRERLSSIRLGLHLVSLVFMVQGVTPLLYSLEPKYFSQFKAVGETLLISSHGALQSSVDLYQRWPGFFGFTSWLDSIAGLQSPLSYMAWCQVFFDLLFAGAFLFAIRSLPLSPRQRWLSVFLLITGNWVAATWQDTFTPQAPAFALSLLIVGIVLRWLSSGPGELKVDWRTRKGALVVLLLLYVPLVFMHPLSPYIVVLWVVALTLVNRVRPLWLAPLLALLAVGFLIPNLSYINKQYGISKAFGNLENNVLPNAPSLARGGSFLQANLGPNLYAEPIIVGLLIVLGLIGIGIRIRQGKGSILMLALLMAPLIIVLGVTYGNEAITRVWLFSYPWLACFISLALWPDPEFEDGLPAEEWSVLKRLARKENEHRSRVPQALSHVRLVGARWITAAVLIVTAGLSIVLNYSQNEIYQVAPSELRAAVHFYGSAPAGVAYYVDPGFPLSVGARYPSFKGEGGGRYYDLFLVKYPLLELIDPAQVMSAVTRLVCNAERPGSPNGYLVLSNQQEKYAEAFGVFDARFFDQMEQHLRESPDWSPYYLSSTVRIYKIMSHCRR
jgi:hypothetical protein